MTNKPTEEQIEAAARAIQLKHQQIKLVAKPNADVVYPEYIEMAKSAIEAAFAVETPLNYMEEAARRVIQHNRLNKQLREAKTKEEREEIKAVRRKNKYANREEA